MGRVFDALKQRQSRQAPATEEPATLRPYSPVVTDGKGSPAFGVKTARLPRSQDSRTDSESAPGTVFEEAPPAEETVPFIEVGAPRGGIEASADVLAVQLVPRKQAVAAVASVPAPPPSPAAIPTVALRPLHSRLLKPISERFAPELSALHEPEGISGRQYQALAAELTQPIRAGRMQVLLGSALSNGIGTTTVLLNVAIAAARSGERKVVVVDANLPRPAVADRLGLPAFPGLTELLQGQVSLLRALQDSGLPNLHVLPAGGPPAGDGEFPSDALPFLLHQLRDRFDLVLVDGACCDRQPHWLALATACDAVYLVTSESQVEQAAEIELTRQLLRQGVPLRGWIQTRK